MSSLANTTLSFKSFCKVDFSGGDLSYNCGLMLLGQFMNNIGITSFLKENFSGDSHRLKRHNDADILLQLILQNLSGSFKDDTADQLAYEPIMNTILLAFSSTAVAVYGVCSRMMGLCTVGVHGINNGLIPIAAYNYGARKAGRIQDSVKWSMLYSGLFYLPILIILEMFPGVVLRLFNASEHMMAIGIPAVRIMAVAWLVFIPSLVFAAALQGLSIPKPSMLLTMLRQAILPVLLALLLSRTGWLPSVWLAFVISELVCIPLAMLFWKRNWSSLRISMECVS